MRRSRDESNKSFTPKWRHFPPTSTVWIHNPFDDDIKFKFADEHNRQFTAVMPAHETSELPGGSIATLGVKKIIDRSIQNSKEDAAQMWNLKIRAKHEKELIVGYRDAPLVSSDGKDGGTINLKSKLSRNDAVVDEVEEEEEQPVMPDSDDVLPEAPFELPEDDLESTDGEPTLPGRVYAIGEEPEEEDEVEVSTKDDESRQAVAAHVSLPTEDAEIE